MSNVTPIRPGKQAGLEDAKNDTSERTRLEAAQRKIGRAQSVMIVVAGLLDHRDDGGNYHHEWDSLNAAIEMLESAIADLEPAVILS
jgi:hypothetical protein